MNKVRLEASVSSGRFEVDGVTYTRATLRRSAIEGWSVVFHDGEGGDLEFSQIMAVLNPREGARIIRRASENILIQTEPHDPVGEVGPFDINGEVYDCATIFQSGSGLWFVQFHSGETKLDFSALAAVPSAPRGDNLVRRARRGAFRVIGGQSAAVSALVAAVGVAR